MPTFYAAARGAHCRGYADNPHYDLSLATVVTSLVAGVQIDPGDEPLDSLTEEWVQGFAELIARRTGAALLGAAASEPLPRTQGAAADYINRHLRTLGL